jgi:hypothetical protein
MSRTSCYEIVYNVVAIVTTLPAEDMEFESRDRQDNFLFFKTSRPALRPNQPSIQWVSGSSAGGTIVGALFITSTYRQDEE